MLSKAITVFPSVKAISRTDLIEFIRQYINPHLEAIEELRTGSDFCLGMKIIFPETISLHAIKFGPNISEISIYNNFKMLQVAFSKVGAEKDVQLDRIMQGNFQANFYFGQWYMGFFFANYAGQVYNPRELRNYKRRANNIVSGCGGGGGTLNYNTMRVPCVTNLANKYNFRGNTSTTVDGSVQTDESYLLDELKKCADRECYVDDLKFETGDLRETITYLQEENKKLAAAIDCTNGSTTLFFEKLKKIQKLCEKEGNHSLRTAVESALYEDNDQ